MQLRTLLANFSIQLGQDCLSKKDHPVHKGMDQENALQVCLQASLMEVVSQLRFLSLLALAWSRFTRTLLPHTPVATPVMFVKMDFCGISMLVYHWFLNSGEEAFVCNSLVKLHTRQSY